MSTAKTERRQTLAQYSPRSIALAAARSIWADKSKVRIISGEFSGEFHEIMNSMCREDHHEQG
ncbi:hypothetical protein [Devosia sp.]|uniref:hypothetical protein n=1 Tax=Devosia sp. TaxID=1871048 RepID=UPI0019DB6EB8|nr:hypothetical protein [Devosia sp.]MBE0582084.1 hypothetical protein [Devosia sp.]